MYTACKEKLYTYTGAMFPILLIPFFVEFDDNNGDVQCYHPDFNHHGINKDSTERLTSMIATDKFNTLDEMHFHAVTIHNRDLGLPLKELTSFNLRHCHNTKGYQFINLQHAHEQLESFFKEINDLNMFNIEDQQHFISAYNDYIVEENGNIVASNINKRTVIDNLEPHENYIKLVKKFHECCTLRFGIVEGLHRTQAIINSLFGNIKTNYSSDFYKQKNLITITSMASPQVDKQNATQDDVINLLKKISKNFEKNKKIVNSKSSKDLMRDLIKLFREKQYIHDKCDIIQRVTLEHVKNINALTNRPDMFKSIRRFITSTSLCDSWLQAINCDNRYNNVSKLDNNLPKDTFKNYTKNVPVLSTWFQGERFQKSTLRQVLRFRDRKIVMLKNTTHEKSSVATFVEHNLASLMLHAVLDKEVLASLTSIVFDDNKKLLPQIPASTSELQSKRKTFDMPTIGE